MSVAAGGDGGASLGHVALIMPCAGLVKCLIHSGFDSAFRLATYGGQLRNDQISRTFEHTLLAERERLDMTEIVEMFEHFCNFKDVTGAHLFRKILKKIFPVVGGRRKICGEGIKQDVAFAGRDRAAQAYFGSIGNWHKDQRIRGCQPQRVERKRYRSNLFLFNLFDHTDTVIGINNFLANLEAHLITSEESYKQ